MQSFFSWGIRPGKITEASNGQTQYISTWSHYGHYSRLSDVYYPQRVPKETAAIQAQPQAASPAASPKGGINNNTKETKKEIDTPIKDTLSPRTEKKINKQIIAETPYLKVSLSDLGGGIAGVQLKKYKESVKGTTDKELIEDVKPYIYLPKGFQQLTKNSTGDDSTYFKADRENITVTDKPEKLVFSGSMDNGTKVKKIYTFYPDNYIIDLSVEIEQSDIKDIYYDIAVISDKIDEILFSLS